MKSDKITSQVIDSYRKELKNEMFRLGASSQEPKLTKDVTIKNAVKRNRKPKDVAWAIIQ